MDLSLPAFLRQNNILLCSGREWFVSMHDQLQLQFYRPFLLNSASLLLLQWSPTAANDRITLWSSLEFLSNFFTINDQSQGYSLLSNLSIFTRSAFIILLIVTVTLSFQDMYVSMVSPGCNWSLAIAYRIFPTLIKFIIIIFVNPRKNGRGIVNTIYVNHYIKSFFFFLSRPYAILWGLISFYSPQNKFQIHYMARNSQILNPLITQKCRWCNRKLPNDNIPINVYDR